MLIIEHVIINMLMYQQSIQTTVLLAFKVFTLNGNYSRCQSESKDVSRGKFIAFTPGMANFLRFVKTEYLVGLNQNMLM